MKLHPWCVQQTLSKTSSNSPQRKVSFSSKAMKCLFRKNDRKSLPYKYKLLKIRARTNFIFYRKKRKWLQMYYPMPYKDQLKIARNNAFLLQKRKNHSSNVFEGGGGSCIHRFIFRIFSLIENILFCTYILYIPKK